MPIIQSGTVNPTSAIVPDLYVVIVPPSQLLLNGVPSNVVGLVGTASWGPVNQPMMVSSMADFAQAFGPLQNRKYDMGTHAAIIAQQAGTAMMCVRVTDGTDVKASNTTNTACTFTAKHSGTYGNDISVILQAGAKANTMAAVVGMPGYAAEVYQNIATPVTAHATVTSAVSASATVAVSSTAGISSGMLVTGTGVTGSPTVSSVLTSSVVLSGSQTSIAQDVVLTFTPPATAWDATWTALANAINNGQNAMRGASSWITATTSTTSSTPTLPSTLAFSGGGDGVASITSATLIGESGPPPTGMYALGSTGLAILDVCDVDDSTQFTTMDAFALQESCYAVMALPAGTTVSGAVTAKRDAGLDSAYSKLMHGDWLWWNDPVNGVARLVSPAAFVAGRLSNLTPQLTTLNKPIYGIAGSQKGGLGGSLNAVYSTADLSTLIQAGIDVVTNPGAGGYDIWTCRSGHTSSTNLTLQLDSYPTLTNYIAKTLASGMGFYIGREITPQLFQNVTGTLTQFMQNLTGAGFLASPDGSTPYAVQCNLQNNPSSQTKIGIVRADVQAEYPSINQTFIVNLQGGSTITISVPNQG